MNTEVPELAMNRTRCRIDAVMAPAYGRAEGIASGLSALRRKRDKRLAARRRERAIAITMSQLSGLDDLVLRDIGIDRGNIYAVSVAVVDDPNVNVRELLGR